MNIAAVLCLAYLESLAKGKALPREFRDADIANDALVEEIDGIWHLTAHGHRHLASLRSELASK